MSAKVLVIDDEPMFQDLIRSILSIAHHRTEVSSNGFEALKLVGQADFDIVIVDYHLPEMDGYALARLLIEHTRYRNRRPVLIAITADPAGLAVRRGSDSIFACILAKPVAPQQLLHVIDVAMRQDHDVGGLISTITTLVADPNPKTAKEASRALWREVGLDRIPRAIVLPPPSGDQIAALSICFDLGDPGDADLVLTTDPVRLPQHVEALGARARHLPVVGVNRIESTILDFEFSILDRPGWGGLATLVRDFATRRSEIATDVFNSQDSGTRLLSHLFVRQRGWVATSGWPIGQHGIDLDLDGIVDGLLAAGQIRPHPADLLRFELTSAGTAAVTEPDDHPIGTVARAEMDTSNSHQGQSPRTRNGDSISVVLLESDPLVRGALTDALTDAGYRIEFANSEIDIAVALEGGDFDAVVVPIETWPPRGLAAQQLMGRTGPVKTTAVIAVLPDRPGLEQPVLASGCVDTVLVRPIIASSLLARLDMLFRTSPPMSEHRDEKVFRELGALIGSDSLDRIAAKFANQLKTSFKVAPTEHLALMSEAHRVKSAAATLGFMRLAETCECLEQVCRRGGDVGSALTDVIEAQIAAIQLIDRICPSRHSPSRAA